MLTGLLRLDQDADRQHGRPARAAARPRAVRDERGGVEPATEASSRNARRGSSSCGSPCCCSRLVGITALCVDIGLWYVEARPRAEGGRHRRAGRRGPPAEPAPTNATTTARDTRPKNSYTHGDEQRERAVLATQVAAQPNQLKVKVSRTFPGILGAVLGVRQPEDHPIRDRPVRDGGRHGQSRQHLRQRAIDAQRSEHDVVERLELHGQHVGQHLRLQSSQSEAVTPATRCCANRATTSAAAPRTPNTRARATSTGSRSTASQRPSGAKLAIQVFDPAAVDVGDHCDRNNLGDADRASPR